MGIIAVLFAAAIVTPPPVRHAPWLVAAREPVCTMAAVFPGDVRVIIEYHPRLDTYHMLLAGRPWRNARSGQQFAITLRSGAHYYSAIGQAVVQEGAEPAVYLPLTAPIKALPRNFRARPNGFIEKLLFTGTEVSTEIQGKPWTRLRPGQSRLALQALAECSDDFSASGRSPLTYRLRIRDFTS